MRSSTPCSTPPARRPRADPVAAHQRDAPAAHPPPARRRPSAVGGPRRLARQRDTAPGRVLPDSAIVAAATASPADRRGARRLPGLGWPLDPPPVAELWPVIDAALPAAGDGSCHGTACRGDGPPPPSRWPDRDPVAAGPACAGPRGPCRASRRLTTCRSENLLTPDLVRRLAGRRRSGGRRDVSAYLREAGARSWQIALTAGPLADAMTATGEPDGSEPDPILEADPDSDAR